jgi:type VI secretion system FHA domain protein
VNENGVRLCDHSANGVYVGMEKVRVSRDVEQNVRAGETLFFGEYMLLVDAELPDPPPANSVPAASPKSAPVARRDSLPHAGTHAAMLEAFCHGAGVDSSSFIGEDPAAVMVRLGVVYRQVVDDLCLLLNERAELKDTLKLDRTTISARDNNPLKWAPPSRIAVDMLKEGDTGFLRGADAFRASFEDLRRHNAAVLASSVAAVDFVLTELSPEALEASSQRPQTFGFLSRSDTLWKAYQARHKALAGENASSGVGKMGEVSRTAYQATLKSLDKVESA